MHPQIGCIESFDKLGVSLECVAQDLENSASSIVTDDQSLLESSHNTSSAVIISDISDSAERSTAPPSSSVIEFQSMANFNNGFTFPSPAVVAGASSAPAFTVGQNGMCAPTSTSTNTSLQFPTPSSSGIEPIPVSKLDCTSVSASWRVPAFSQPPMSFSGMPRSLSCSNETRASKICGKLTKKKNWRPASTMCVVHGKRKATVDPENADVGKKVRINEDRMAARMQDLHLDNNNLEWHPNLEESWFLDAPNNNNEEEIEELEEDETCSSGADNSKQNHLPRLELADELKLDFKTREILPRVFMEELRKPSMQLVLWKPPGDFVKDVVKELHDTEAQSSVEDSPHSMDMEIPTTSQSHIPWLPPPPSDLPRPNAAAMFDSLDDEMDL